MKINRYTKIVGVNIVLVPYREHHVPKYHNWMKSEELQKLTASEPLSLEDEYEMQKSWMNDEDKCTFIILDKKMYDNNTNEIDSMIGDTNIFMTDSEFGTAEVEIMIAEKSARGKRYGWEAVILMMSYGIQFIGMKTYEAKISLANDISINMFKKLGFSEKSTSEIFQEITLAKSVSEDWTKWLCEQFCWEIQNYS